MTGQDLAIILAVVVVGPWGLVLAIALIRGYDLRLLFTLPRHRPFRDEEDEEGSRVSYPHTGARREGVTMAPSDNANPNADKGQQTAEEAKAAADARKAAKEAQVDNTLPTTPGDGTVPEVDNDLPDGGNAAPKR